MLSKLFEPNIEKTNKPPTKRWASGEAFKQHYTKCQLCPLHLKCTQKVFWAGPDIADMMIIGEAPGENEDRSGVPFCGLAGQKLTSLLTQAGLSRESIHISNALLCRPTDGVKNLTPTEQQVIICSTRLMEQIALVNPRVILCLGKPASVSLLSILCGIPNIKNMSMGDIRMSPRRVKINGTEVYVVSTYHPAYLLRQERTGNFNTTDATISDIRNAKNLLATD